MSPAEPANRAPFCKLFADAIKHVQAEAAIVDDKMDIDQDVCQTRCPHCRADPSLKIIRAQHAVQIGQLQAELRDMRKQLWQALAETKALKSQNAKLATTNQPQKKDQRCRGPR